MIYNIDGHNIAFSPSKVEIWFLYKCIWRAAKISISTQLYETDCFNERVLYDVLVIQKEKHYNTWLYIFLWLFFVSNKTITTDIAK